MTKFALITGASQGIGREIALQLAVSGIFVIVNYSKSHENAENVVLEIKKAGGRCEAICADVSDEIQVSKMFADFARFSLHLDYLVNNAGIDIPQRLESYDAEAWRRILDVNVTGKFLVLKHAIPYLKKSAHARVVNVASPLAWKPLEEASSYCCSEAAIIMLTKCAALELAPYKIRVNAVCPGFTRTPLNERLCPDEKIWIETAEANPSNRIAEPNDVAKAVMFLLSNEAEYINGTHLVVDGGSMLT